MKRRDDEREPDPEEEAPVKKAVVKEKKASTQNAIFTDDALGYAFAVPPSFQVPALSLNPAHERIFIELMTSDRKLKASIEGSN